MHQTIECLVIGFICGASGGGVFHPEDAIDSITKLTLPTFIRTELDRGSSFLHPPPNPHTTHGGQHTPQLKHLDQTELNRNDLPLSLAKREAWYVLVFSGVLVLYKCVCYTHTCLVLLYFSFSDFLHESQTGNSAASTFSDKLLFSIL